MTIKSQEHILLVNFDFPPNQGIGGRRWGKLAKGLANQGYMVHVIKAKPIERNISCAWADDVRHPNIKVSEIRRTFPRVVSHVGSSIIDKILYRLMLLYLKAVVKGTIYDLSAQWGNVLVRECDRICKENNISRVIATGAPWHLLYVLACWNDRGLKLPFIVDFRDPWHQARIHGMKNLSASRREYEASKQARVLASASCILSPDPVILNEMADFAKAKGIVIKNQLLLRHFFDEDDFVDLLSGKEVSDERSFFKIVYGGDIYQDMEMELHQVLAFFNGNQQRKIRVELHIYSDARIPEVLSTLEAVKFFPTAGKAFYQIAASADALLIILPKHLNHVFSTKFYDYLPLKRPFIVATQGGAVADYVVEKKLGFVWMTGDKFPWYDELLDKGFISRDDLDITPYSLTATIDKLVSSFQ